MSPITAASSATVTKESKKAARLAMMELSNMLSVAMALAAVVRLNVPSAIHQSGPDTPLSATEILGRLRPTPPPSASPSNLQRLLRLLSSYGVFAEHLSPDSPEPVRRYSLTDMGRTLVADDGVEGGLSYAPYVLQHHQDALVRAWPLLHEAVLDPGGPEPFARANGGMAAYNYYGGDEAANDLMRRAMWGVSLPFMESFLEEYGAVGGLDGVGTLVDVGGSSGACLRMIMQRVERLKTGVNFDLPEVVAGAPEFPGVMADRRPRRPRREDALQHRAEHTDTARSLEPVSHLDLLREWPVTCDRFTGALDAAGVGSLRHLSYITLDSRLLTALVERWSPTTNTFLLPVGEMTITLEDVAVILGVRVDGPALIGPVGIGPGSRWATWPECCDDLLGRHPLEHVVYENPRNPNDRSTFKMGQAGAQTCLPLRWLRWQFARETYEDISYLELTRSVRGYILYLIGCFLMPDTSGSEVHLQWLPLLEDLGAFEQYSLGGAVLAHLYRELAESVRPSKARIAGCLHLMQVWAWEHFHVGRPILYVPSWEAVEGKPLGYRWNEGWTRSVPMNTVVHYRNELDTLQQSQVIWDPYTDDILASLPAICRDGNELRLARVPLIAWVKVEWYLPDRVMRQFGYQQNIDLEGIPKEFKRVDARGKGGMDWSWYHRIECALWDRRREFIREPVLVDRNPQTALAIYMTWYRNWARCYLVQPPPEPPQTFYPRAPYEREFYDYFRETTTTLAPLDEAGAPLPWIAARQHLMTLADDIADRLHLEDYRADAGAGPSATEYTPYGYTSGAGADAGAGPSHTEYPPVMYYDEQAIELTQTQETQMTFWDALTQTTPTVASGVQEQEEEEEDDPAEPRARRGPDRYTPGSHAVYRRRRRPRT